MHLMTHTTHQDPTLEGIDILTLDLNNGSYQLRPLHFQHQSQHTSTPTNTQHPTPIIKQCLTPKPQAAKPHRINSRSSKQKVREYLTTKTLNSTHSHTDCPLITSTHNSSRTRRTQCPGPHRGPSAWRCTRGGRFIHVDRWRRRWHEPAWGEGQESGYCCW